MPSRGKTRTVYDRLSHLNYAGAVRLLGRDGAALLRSGGGWDLDPTADCKLTRKKLVVRVGFARVTVAESASHPGRLAIHCSECSTKCEHAGAALSLVLEEKLALGLAAPPSSRVPLELLSEQELVARAIEERAERAERERMRMTSYDSKTPWTDYMLTSQASGKSYRVALRGLESGVSYCSCPDFRKNSLGTCKHLIYALARVRKKFTKAQLSRPYRRKQFTLHLRYGERVELWLAPPSRMPADAERIAGPLLGKPLDDVHVVVRAVGRLEALGHEVRIHPDAEEFMAQQLHRDRIAGLVSEIRRDPAAHELRGSLLRAELLPYQLDGIAFAVGAGRAILADDMGLGKTIQGIGVAELLAREAGVQRVLVVCPASLKAQWKSEVERFSHRSCALVVGRAAEREEHYQGGAFFTVCNYEQVLRDILHIERVPWDLIILDEGQRIKNWEAKTSRIIKGLRSRHALVLSGTPLENNLDELFSVIEFVDEQRLGPAFRFYHRHRVLDQEGKLVGYRNIDDLRKRLVPILLRRTRDAVLGELPERTTKIVRVAPTDEQLAMHQGHMQTVTQIVRKSYINEMDLLRLRRALLFCRLSANGTAFVDKQHPGYSSKLEVLGELLDKIRAEPDRKVVLFSEWTSVLDRIEPMLAQRSLGHVRLDGSVPQKQRAALVRTFRQDSDCRFFLTTNAGSTGLNLQAANTIINVDLPWNPAVLEQRIARAHRMGQKRPVHVYLLVTSDTIEENMLGTLSGKHQLALAALDPDAEADEVALRTGVGELKAKLEVLLGQRADAPVDESERERVEQEVRQKARRAQVSLAAGQMLSGALQLIASSAEPSAATDELAARIEASLAQCVGQDEQGHPTLTITLPPAAPGAEPISGLQSMARALATLLATQAAVGS